MIESHVDRTTWSDAKQQVTPELSEMMSSIIWRKERYQFRRIPCGLEKLRQQINHWTTN
jgi:hypothetical protein